MNIVFFVFESGGQLNFFFELKFVARKYQSYLWADIKSKVSFAKNMKSWTNELLNFIVVN